MINFDEFENGSMIEQNKVDAVNRMIVPMFFLIDTSRHMHGEKMNKVNQTMTQIMHDLQEWSNADFEIRYAALNISTECIWEIGEDGLVECDGKWSPLEAGGLFCFNTACQLLNDKLSARNNGFFKLAAGKIIASPVIILFTDSYSSDGFGLDGISILKENLYFVNAYKIAITISDEADLQLCMNFTDKGFDDFHFPYTDRGENVWESYHRSALKRIIGEELHTKYMHMTMHMSGSIGTWDGFEEGGIIEAEPSEIINRRITPVFFLIDVSGSMSGTKIDTVNNAMEEIMRDLSDLDSADFNLKYAVLSFGSECRWETGDNGLIACDGEWANLDTCNGEADFNTVCRMLKEKLSVKHGFFNFVASIFPPVIVLLTDGVMNEECKTGIEELKKNKFFKGSVKLAMAIGADANQQFLVDFTEDKETVWTAYNERAFKRMLEHNAIAYS